jgi:hypothetical protein
MNPIIRRRLERAARHRVAVKPSREWDPIEGLWYCPALPCAYLEPCVPLVTRVVAEKAERLRESIRLHGLANPLITVSVLPSPNFEDWREFRFRFLFECAAPVKIVVGHNRYHAIKALGWDSVPVIHCGPLPGVVQQLDWSLVEFDDVQSYFKDGRVGIAPFSLTMVEFTPPLKGVPAGFEPDPELT